jgi:death-on-curing family protein
LGGIGQAVRYLTAEQLKIVNQRMIRATGGLYLTGEENVVYLPSLETLVNYVQNEIVGKRQPSTVWRMAAFYLDRIARGEGVFHDGNKRTALEAARLFLEGAGYRLTLSPANEAVEFVTSVARGAKDREGIVEWLKAHSKRKKAKKN